MKKQRAAFIDCIEDELGNQLQEKLSKVNFFSVLTDGSTDTSIVEKEPVFVRNVDTKPPGEKYAKVCTSFVDLADLKT